MRQQRLSATVIDVEGGRTEVSLEAFDLVQLPSRNPMTTVIREAAYRASVDGQAGAASSKHTGGRA